MQSLLCNNSKVPTLINPIWIQVEYSCIPIKQAGRETSDHTMLMKVPAYCNV